MTTTPTDARPEPGPGTPPGPEPRNLGALRRSRTDRHIAGVAGGLAQHLRIDPIIVRVTLVVLVFFGGAGLVLYIGAWLFVPEEGRTSAAVTLDDRSRAFVLYIVAAIAALALLGDTAGHVHAPWFVLLIAVIVLLVISERRGELRLPGRRNAARSAAGSAEEPFSAQAAAPSTYAPAPPPPTDQPFALPPADPPAAPPADPSRSPATLPVNPRKRGPILFWFTLALIALAEGALGIVDLAGAPVAGPAYPALAVGIVGAMLVLGAFWGRAGGLILIGFLASVVLIAGLAADKWQLDTHGHSTTYTPTTAAQVRADYTMGTGELRLDLSQLRDPAALAGHSVTLGGHVGEIDVVLPAGLGVSAHAEVEGPGEVEVLGADDGGLHPRLTGSVAGAGTPFYVHADLNVGHISVETSDE